MDGKRLYADNYRYAGDFKDGYACVKLISGGFMHIDGTGAPLNDKVFNDLGVFHKGFATAKDNEGWHHIDVHGNALYAERYLIAEPFYNGFALVTNFDGNKLIINENGEEVLWVG